MPQGFYLDKRLTVPTGLVVVKSPPASYGVRCLSVYRQIPYIRSIRFFVTSLNQRNSASTSDWLRQWTPMVLYSTSTFSGRCRVWGFLDMFVLYLFYVILIQK